MLYQPMTISDVNDERYCRSLYNADKALRAVATTSTSQTREAYRTAVAEYNAAKTLVITSCESL